MVQFSLSYLHNRKITLPCDKQNCFSYFTDIIFSLQQSVQTTSSMIVLYTYSHNKNGVFSWAKSLTSSFPSSAKILPRLYLIDVTKAHKKYTSKDV